MDKSLDDIIATRPRKGGRGRRTGGGGGARAEVLGKAPANPATKARVATAAKGAATAQPADKIIVSNLPQDVNEAQVKELFHSTVGPLRDVTLHYDASGRSKGVASVQFQRKGDGTKAFQQYNNRLIDGKRPMKIEIVVDPTKAPPAPLASRVAPAPAAAGAAKGGRGGGRRRGGGGGRSKNERPPKSAADLDAEMEDYTQNTGAAASAPAAAV